MMHTARRRRKKDGLGWAEMLFNRSVNFVPPAIREPLDWVERNGERWGWLVKKVWCGDHWVVLKILYIGGVKGD
jgi:hypothetical protein